MKLTANKLVLAIPSKGQLYESTLRFLEACEMPVRRSGQGREYIGHLDGVSGVEVLFLRTEEIATRVERGGVQLGITGEDLYREYGEARHLSCVLLPKLGYGHARLVVAVPRVWIDVTSLDDLEEVALLFRQRRNRCLRVATKFPRLTREFFAKNGIADYLIVQSGGATEGAPASGVADIIVDLSSTGATLAQNHLKEISEVMPSQACLIASTRQSDWNKETLGGLQQIVEMIEAHLRAKASKIVQFATPQSRAARIATELERRFHCEMSEYGRPLEHLLDRSREPSENPPRSLQAEPLLELTMICPGSALYPVVLYLREAHCKGIMVSHSDLIFKPSDAVKAFRQLLHRLQEEPELVAPTS